MEEVSPPIYLFLIESAAPVKMHSCFLDLGLDYCGVPLGLVEVWMLENAVHIGDPINSWGRCSSRICSASIRRAGSLKSHGLPSEFVVVRSSATPGSIPSLEFLAAVAVTLVRSIFPRLPL